MKAVSAYNNLNNLIRNFLIGANITITNFAGKLSAIINRSILFVINHLLGIIKSRFLPIIGDLTMIIGRFPMIIGRFPMIIGHFPMIIGRFPMIIGCFPMIIGKLLPIMTK